MNIQLGKTKLVSGGRIQLPADIRRAMGIKDGDWVKLEYRDGQLHVTPYSEVLRRVRERVRPYIVEGVSVVDELIADRRAEAESE